VHGLKLHTGLILPALDGLANVWDRMRFFLASRTSGKSNMDKAIQKMKVSEDPSSPEMQQAAAKQAACKKEAKIQKLTGSARKAFMKDCTK
jgi:psiF repeat